MKTNEMFELRVKPDTTRRHGVCSVVKQLVIIIVDCSPSMEGEKARQAYTAMCEFVAALAQPMNKDGFIVLVIYFNSKAKVARPWKTARDHEGDLPPLDIDSATNMTAAMELANRELAVFQKQGGITYLRPVGLFLTDGCFNEGGSPVAASTEFKADADLVTVAFGDDADEGLLEEMATSPQHFYRVKNGAELRNFMATASATIMISKAQNMNATIRLSQMKRD